MAILTDQLLHERVPHAHGEGAVDLTLVADGVEDGAHVMGRDQLAQMHLARLRVHLDLGYLDAEAVVFGMSPVWVGLRHELLARSGHGLGGQVCQGHAALRVATTRDPALLQHNLLLGTLQEVGGQALELVLHLLSGSEGGPPSHMQDPSRTDPRVVLEGVGVQLLQNHFFHGNGELLGHDLPEDHLAPRPRVQDSGEEGDVALAIHGNDGVGDPCAGRPLGQGHAPPHDLAAAGEGLVPVGCRGGLLEGLLPLHLFISDGVQTLVEVSFITVDHVFRTELVGVPPHLFGDHVQMGLQGKEDRGFAGRAHVPAGHAVGVDHVGDEVHVGDAVAAPREADAGQAQCGGISAVGPGVEDHLGAAGPHAPILLHPCPHGDHPSMARVCRQQLLVVAHEHLHRPS